MVHKIILEARVSGLELNHRDAEECVSRGDIAQSLRALAVQHFCKLGEWEIDILL
jgi:hypothetical protein